MAERVAVIFGGRSAEHDVSIITAHVPIIDSLVALGYEIVPIYISTSGSWYSEPGMADMAYFKDGQHETKIKSLKPITLDINHGLKVVFPGLLPKTVTVDLVFPAMHGTYGEDGSLMGLLRMANVPFVGCDIFASAVAMDKALMKQVVSAVGVPVTPFTWFTREEWARGTAAVHARIAKLTYPLFVKPVHLGSSIGISKVRTAHELENAIEVALHYDSKVLVEEGVENLIEVTLPIMGNDVLTMGAIERPLNKTEFFDFNDKYLGGGKGAGANSAYSEIPANIEPALSATVLEYGERTYRTLDCAGIARVDFLIDSMRGVVFVNEVNTLPGSLYHHNWRHQGITAIELVSCLITLGRERAVRDAGVTHTFQSSILSKMKPKGT